VTRRTRGWPPIFTSSGQRAWLVRETGVTTGTATGHAAWARRAAEHPQVIEALAEGHRLSESVARTICTWTGKLPADCRAAADAILIVAAKTGADVRGLAEVFGGSTLLPGRGRGLSRCQNPRSSARWQSESGHKSEAVYLC